MRPGDARLLAPSKRPEHRLNLLQILQLCFIRFLPKNPKDCVFSLWLTVLCGPPDHAEGKAILNTDKMSDLGGMTDATAEDSHLN